MMVSLGCGRALAVVALARHITSHARRAETSGEHEQHFWLRPVASLRPRCRWLQRKIRSAGIIQKLARFLLIEWLRWRRSCHLRSRQIVAVVVVVAVESQVASWPQVQLTRVAATGAIQIRTTRCSGTPDRQARCTRIAAAAAAADSPATASTMARLHRSKLNAAAERRARKRKRSCPPVELHHFSPLQSECRFGRAALVQHFIWQR